MTISFNQVKHVILLILLTYMSYGSLGANGITPDSVFDRSFIKPRVENMDFFVRTNYNSDIERHIKGFVLLARKNAQRILGDATIYFPSIEQKIKERNLPDGLKYLTVVESMLDPRAESYAGARGMWQLMPFIAEDYNIKMDGDRDERFDVDKSSAAGLDYLNKLYSRFNNWELALAAYNCGPNRISKVLRLSGKRTYWGIRHLLPRQTREFVPKLIAVKYLFHYYQYHGLEPQFPDIDLQLTRSIEVDGGQPFQRISQLTELNKGLIAFLNPAYISEPTPIASEKIELILPARVADAVITHQSVFDYKMNEDILYRGDSSSIANPYYREYYAISDTTDLKQFCEERELSVSQIWLWNKLDNGLLVPGQELFSYKYAPLKLEYHRAERLVPIYIDTIDLHKIERKKVDDALNSNSISTAQIVAEIGAAGE